MGNDKKSLRHLVPRFWITTDLGPDAPEWATCATIDEDEGEEIAYHMVEEQAQILVNLLNSFEEKGFT